MSLLQVVAVYTLDQLRGGTSSGLFLGWAVALGSKSMGIGCRIGSWGSSLVSCPLLSSVIQDTNLFFFCPRPTSNWGILQFLRSF